jgi:signal transduction histidine kinase
VTGPHATKSAPHPDASPGRPGSSLATSQGQPTSARGLWAAIDATTGTIAFRLAATIAAAVMVAGALAITALFWLSSVALSRNLVAQLSEETAELEAIARGSDPRRLLTVITDRGTTDPARLYLLVGPDNTRIAGNLARWPSELADRSAGGTFVYTPPGSSTDRFAAGVTTRMPDGRGLLVARDLADQQALAGQARWLLLAGFGLFALTGLAAGLAMSRLVLGRIAAMTATTERIVAGDFSGRVPVTRNDDELDRLAHHLNAMLDRIEQLMAGLREVSDNIAHDLRTPLTRLRHRAEAALRDASGAPAHRAGLEHVIEEADALIATFNALLLIARLEAGALETSAETFDLGAVVVDLVDLYQPLAEENGLVIDAHIEPVPMVTANRQLVGQAIANLIDNAIKYGRRRNGDAMSGSVITVRCGADNGHIRVIVADHGPGIAPADRGRVLKRFVRLEASRTAPGTGLGLSLVAAVSRLIGGRLVLEDNAPGLKVTFELPARAVDRTA